MQKMQKTFAEANRSLVVVALSILTISCSIAHTTPQAIPNRTLTLHLAHLSVFSAESSRTVNLSLFNSSHIAEIAQKYPDCALIEPLPDINVGGSTISEHCNPEIIGELPSLNISCGQFFASLSVNGYDKASVDSMLVGTNRIGAVFVAVGGDARTVPVGRIAVSLSELDMSYHLEIDFLMRNDWLSSLRSIADSSEKSKLTIGDHAFLIDNNARLATQMNHLLSVCSATQTIGWLRP
jgi:hypothetical protein